MRRGLFLALAAVVLVAGVWFALRRGERETTPTLPGVVLEEERPGPGGPAPLSRADLTLAGLRLGMSARELRAALGRPAKVSLQAEPSPQNPDWTTYWVTWRYEGVEAILMNSAPNGQPQPADPGVVFAFTASGGAHRTRRGVKVGDPTAMVTRRYGRGEEDEGRLYYYDGETAYLSFAVAGGAVTEISIGSLID